MLRWPVIAVLALLGCAPGTQTRRAGPVRETVQIDAPTGTALLDLTREDDTTTGRIAAPPELVWRQLPAVYAAIGFGPETLAVVDGGARRIAVRNHRTRRVAGERMSRLVRCGQGLGAPKADNGQTRITLESWLEAAKDGGTTVHTRLVASARDIGTSTAPVACSSTGVLERIIGERLAARAEPR